MISPSSHTAKAHEPFYQIHFLLPLSNTSNCCPRKEFPRWVALQQWPWKGGNTSPKYFPSQLNPFEATSDVGSKWVPSLGWWWTYHISARNLSPTAVLTCCSPQWYPTFSLGGISGSCHLLHSPGVWEFLALRAGECLKLWGSEAWECCECVSISPSFPILTQALPAGFPESILLRRLHLYFSTPPAISQCPHWVFCSAPKNSPTTCSQSLFMAILQPLSVKSLLLAWVIMLQETGTSWLKAS